MLGVSLVGVQTAVATVASPPPIAKPAAPISSGVLPPEVVHNPSESMPRWSPPTGGTPVSPGHFDVPVVRGSKTRAGTSPITVTDDGAGSPLSVGVDILASPMAGVGHVTKLPFAVHRSDGGQGSAPVSVQVDYSSLLAGEGGDFAQRLQVVKGPDCMLTTPSVAGCAGTPVTSTNDVSASTLTVIVDSGDVAGPSTATAAALRRARTGSASGTSSRRARAAFTAAATTSSGTVYAVAGSSTPYAAAPLTANGKWNVGLQSGGFSYSYPVSVPPVVAGVSPTLALNYSSQSVDGRASSTNTQASWTGLGWDLNPGSIQQRFASCFDLGHTTGATAGTTAPVLDASSPPAVAAWVNSTQHVTTAAFTPPSGSLLVAVTEADGNYLNSFALSDSRGLTWRKVASVTPAGEGPGAIWVADGGSVTTGMTVTVTPGGSGSNADPVSLTVLVYTGAASAVAQTGASAGVQDSGTNGGITVTPTSSASVIVGGLDFWRGPHSFGVLATTTLIAHPIAPPGPSSDASMYVFRSSGPSSTSATTYGLYNVNSPVGSNINLVAAEILPAPVAGSGDPLYSEECDAGTAYYSITLDGMSGDLVYDSASGLWHMKDDNGWKIERLHLSGGVSNGDALGEYFKVTDLAGTQYFFGSGSDGTLATNSVFTMPVYADTAGRPCYSSSTVNSWCQRGWKFNLDKIIDTDGNKIVYEWAQETNLYARNHATPTAYVRGGYLARVDYRYRNAEASPGAKVEFTVADRCTTAPSCAAPAPGAGSTYPDVPTDLICTATCDTTTQASPTFFTTKELTRIDTFARLDASSAWQPVGSLGLSYNFPDPGYSLAPSLWLATLTPSGTMNPGGGPGVDLARGKTATASTIQDSRYPASAAVDGDSTTRWSSGDGNGQWLSVDLGASYSLSSVKINWDSAYDFGYKIQVSPDGTTWADGYSTTVGTGSTETDAVTGSGRYVRLLETTPGYFTNTSILDFQVYGTPTVNTSITTSAPPTTFTGTVMSNRVISPLISRMFRITSIMNSLGAQTNVTYGQPNGSCALSSSPYRPDPSTNTYDCYPAYVGAATDDNDQLGLPHNGLIWQNRFVVTQVTVHDAVGGTPDAVTNYSYGPAAWAFVTDPLTPVASRTWGDSRGYQTVTVSEPAYTDATGYASFEGRRDTYLYYRGMDGDRTSSGGAKSVTITDSTGGVHTDSPELAGQLAETRSFRGPNGASTETTGSTTSYTAWESTHDGTSATRAHFVRPAQQTDRQTISTGTRSSVTNTSYDTTTGMATAVQALGDPTTTTDDTCTATQYVPGTSQITGTQTWDHTSGSGCPTVAAPSGPPTITAIGTPLTFSGYIGSTTTQLPAVSHAVGDVIVASANGDSWGVSLSSVSGGGVTAWTRAGSVFADGADNRMEEIWYGVVTSATAAPITFTWPSAITNAQAAAQEFNAGTSPTWSVDTSGNAAAPFPSLTTATSGELYFGTAFAWGNAAAGTTSGATYAVPNTNQMLVWNTNATGTLAPSGTGAGSIAVLLKAVGGGPALTLPPVTGGAWTLNGSAKISGTSVQLTPDTAGEAGDVVYPTPVPSEGLDATFTSTIGGGTGADGIALMLLDATKTTPGSLGAIGGGFGFRTLDGVAAVLNTYQGPGDPSSNFIGVTAGGNSINWLGTNTSVPNLRSGSHTVHVHVAGGHVTVAVDGGTPLDVTVTVPPSVLIGFGGATGGLNDQHAVSNTTITAVGSTTGVGGPGSGLPLRRTDFVHDTAGHVTQVTNWVDATSSTVTKGTYDACGRPLNSTDANGNVTTTAYTPSGCVMPQTVTVTNPLGQSATSSLDYATGVITDSTDANNKATHMQYDGLGRVVKAWRPGADRNGPASVQYTYTLSQSVASSVRSDVYVAGAYQSSWTFVDSLGETRQTQTQTASNQVLLGNTDYASGLAVITEAAVGTTGTAGQGLLTFDKTQNEGGWNATTYDAFGRPLISSRHYKTAAATSTSYSYAGDTTTVTPPAPLGQTITTTDVLGRTVGRQEPAGTNGAIVTTAYVYNNLGQLTKLTDAEGNVTTYAFDGLGRGIATTEPDAGTSSTAYDPNGNATLVTDAKNQVIAATFDALDRPLTQRANSATGPLLTARTYDTAPDGTVLKGVPFTATSYDTSGNAFTTTFTYDANYLVSAKTLTVPSSQGALAGTYSVTGMTYDETGAPLSANLPAVANLPAETLTYGYDSVRRLLSVSGNPNGTSTAYVQTTSYDTLGRLATQTHGNAGALTTQDTVNYDGITTKPSLLSTTLTTATGAVSYATYDTLGYDAAANVARYTRYDPTNGSHQSACNSYDPVGRLSNAHTVNGTACAAYDGTGQAPYNLSYTYSPTGNMLTETTTAGSNQYTYPTAGNPLGVSQPHAVSSIGGNGYTYDANGSMTAAPGRTQTWDIFNRLASVTTATGTESYIYDADGNRLIRKNPTSTTLFTDNQEITLTGTTLTATRYYGTSAMRSGPTDLWYLATNDQGSDTAAVQVATGTVTQELYDPWGKARGTNGQPAGDRSFLNKPTDATGLSYLGARFYDPVIHKFLSADPLAGLSDPQSLNPYSYAGNNPTSASDKSGLYDDRPSWWGPTTPAVPARPIKPVPAPPAAAHIPAYWLNTQGVSSGNSYGKTRGAPKATFHLTTAHEAHVSHVKSTPVTTWDHTASASSSRSSGKSTTQKATALPYIPGFNTAYGPGMDFGRGTSQSTSGWRQGLSVGLGIVSEVTGALAIGFAFTGVGEGVAGGFEGISLVAGGGSAALDCAHKRDSTCGMDIAAVALSGTGFGLKVAGNFGKLGKDSVELGKSLDQAGSIMGLAAGVAPVSEGARQYMLGG
jgi:RHS repeat-associated protein